MAAPATMFIDGNCLLDAACFQLNHSESPARWPLVVERFRFLRDVDLADFQQVFAAVERAYDIVWPNIIVARELFCAQWDLYAAAWYKILADTFDCDLPSGEVFRAYVGIGNMSPRSIARQEFLIPFYAAPQNACILAAHETSHFYYYHSIRGQDAPDPHPDWLLSEILVPILFSLPQVTALFPFPLPQTTYAASSAQLDLIRREFLAWNTRNSWLSTRAHLIDLLSDDCAAEKEFSRVRII